LGLGKAFRWRPQLSTTPPAPRRGHNKSAQGRASRRQPQSDALGAVSIQHGSPERAKHICSSHTHRSSDAPRLVSPLQGWCSPSFITQGGATRLRRSALPWAGLLCGCPFGARTCGSQGAVAPGATRSSLISSSLCEAKLEQNRAFGKTPIHGKTKQTEHARSDLWVCTCSEPSTAAASPPPRQRPGRRRLRRRTDRWLRLRLPTTRKRVQEPLFCRRNRCSAECPGSLAAGGT
jgi:hypothetical protein